MIPTPSPAPYAEMEKRRGSGASIHMHRPRWLPVPLRPQPGGVPATGEPSSSGAAQRVLQPQRGARQLAQLTGPCSLSAPSPPSPLRAGTYYPASASGASVRVNGVTVGLDIYTPRTLSAPRTRKTLLFVYGGQFQDLSSGAAADIEGIGQALITDTSENVLTVVPDYEKYTFPSPWTRRDPSTPLARHHPYRLRGAAGHRLHASLDSTV